jgi:competence protein ComEA
MTSHLVQRYLAKARRAATLAAALLTAASAAAIELNTASQAELERIKGIGVALSQRLMAERRARPFADWQDLAARVPGIGPRVAQRLSAQGLRVNGEGVDPPARAASNAAPAAMPGAPAAH